MLGIFHVDVLSPTISDPKPQISCSHWFYSSECLLYSTAFLWSAICKLAICYIGCCGGEKNESFMRTTWNDSLPHSMPLPLNPTEPSTYPTRELFFCALKKEVKKKQKKKTLKLYLNEHLCWPLLCRTQRGFISESGWVWKDPSALATHPVFDAIKKGSCVGPTSPLIPLLWVVAFVLWNKNKTKHTKKITKLYFRGAQRDWCCGEMSLLLCL